MSSVPGVARHSSSSPRASRAFGPAGALAALVAAGTLLFGAPAYAQDDGEKATAAFEAGRAALQRGDLVEACAKLAESDRLAPSGRTLLNLGDCYERRGMFASAYTKFLEAAARAVRAGKPEAELHARERAAHVEWRVSRVMIVTRRADAPGLEIKRDGALLPRTAWDTPELVDPGTQHVYEAMAPDHAPFSATVVTEPGKTSSVELVWPSPAPAKNDQPSADVSGHRSKALAFGILGVGAAGLVVGTIGGLEVLDAKSTVSAHCDSVTHECHDDEGFDASKRGATWSIISPIAFGVGLVGVGIGTWLFLRAPEKARSTSVTITPQFGTTGAGFSLSGVL